MKLICHRFFAVFLGLCSLISVSGADREAFAQNCASDFELIFKLRTSELGSFNLWDAVYGEKSDIDTFGSALVLENGHVIAAGMREYGAFTGVGPALTGRRFVLAQIDMRGRTVWHQDSSVADLQEVKKILPGRDGGYAVLVSTQPKGGNLSGRILFTNAKGEITDQKSFAKTGKDLVVRALERSWDNKGYLMMATVTEAGSGYAHTVFYRLNEKGGVMYERSYRPGLYNVILDIRRSDGKYYVASGHMQNQNGRQNAWVMKLNDTGEILWQQQYPRGAGARFTAMADLPEDRMVLAGQALPATGEPSAGWMMVVGRQGGDPIWQRYFSTEQHNGAVDIMAGEDGLISMLMNSKPALEDGGVRRDSMAGNFMRLVSINARGILYGSDIFYQGKGAEGTQLLPGYGRSRVMVGTTEQIYQEEPKTPDAEPVTHTSLEGFIVASPAAEIHEDPCAHKEKPEETAADAESLFP